ncbi:MAG: DUF4037 domain-containing protein [Chloroflexota bacterium]
MTDAPLELAQKLAARFAQLPQIEAVSLTGSQMMGIADASSDIDLYIYQHEDIPVSDRKALAAPYREGAEFDLSFWGKEDTWYDLASGLRVEAIYWKVRSIEDNVEYVLRCFETAKGYSTAVLHSVRNGHILFDRSGWLHRLQAEVQQPYPDGLRSAIIAANHPIMRKATSSYVQQLGVAAQRRDLVSLNHRTAALLASYFDILFALNGVMNPGEKRLIPYAETLCDKRPPELRAQVEGLLLSIASGDVTAAANALIDGLDDLLRAEGLYPL